MMTPFTPTAQEKVAMEKPLFVARSELDVFHFFADHTYVSERHDSYMDITVHDLARWFIHNGKVCHGHANFVVRPNVLPEFVQSHYVQYLARLVTE